MVNKKAFLVKIPLENIKAYANDQGKIRYRLEHNSCPHVRGRNKIYPNSNARRQAFIERRRARIAQQRVVQTVA
jgi:hypothetical protein